VPVTNVDVGRIVKICQTGGRRVRYGVLGAAISTRVGHPNARPQDFAQATVTMLNTFFGSKCASASWVVDETGFTADYGQPPNELFDPDWSREAPVFDDVQNFLAWLDRASPDWDDQLQSTYP
jgi:hypothetical protein